MVVTETWRPRNESPDQEANTTEALRTKVLEILRSLRTPRLGGEVKFAALAMSSFENTGRRGLDQFKHNPSIASFQHGVLESRLTWMSPEASLRAWMSALHAGMTKICILMFCKRA
jgi:hypothetical protein